MQSNEYIHGDITQYVYMLKEVEPTVMARLGQLAILLSLSQYKSIGEKCNFWWKYVSTTTIGADMYCFSLWVVDHYRLTYYIARHILFYSHPCILNYSTPSVENTVQSCCPKIAFSSPCCLMLPASSSALILSSTTVLLLHGDRLPGQSPTR